MPAPKPIIRLSDMQADEEGDLFVLLSAKEELLTRRGEAVLQGDLPRRPPGGELSDLERRPPGRRLPAAVDAGRVLQGPRRPARDELRAATGTPQDPRGDRCRRGGRLRSDDVFTPIAVLPGGDVRRASGDRREGDSGGAVAADGGVDPRGRAGAAAAAPRGAAAPSRDGRRPAGAHAECDGDLPLPGREVRQEVPRHVAAAGPRPGGGRGDPPRHRQAPRNSNRSRPTRSTRRPGP